MSNGRRRALGAGAAVAVIGVAVAVALVAGGSQQDSGDRQTDRQKAVAERGQSVMPFDLEQTTHRFTPTATGGIQDVVADQRGDAEQVDLIRAHLRKEAQAFSRGDFSDPSRIHGADMPGLAELQDGYDRFEVRYEERADGATLTYATDDSALVDALHSWFEAQLGDHGAHAKPGH
ncbi:aspartate carbamoyltransferase [Streptomyces gobiensis]|uniref:aspartate carbamoyltransferase n=1 Tax=Streptomyces gobiensis TaxID=2875706 RepID=UPI001E48E19A|nr:aspartate carbamoyltransferase [Streptomyces gobiensis]UGY94280.1 aspartate carbamoyltransferase [Streptomyces gobiensis]